jgi:hypothetical protein
LYVRVAEQVGPGLLRYRVSQKIEGGSRKGMHIAEPLGATGLKCDSALNGAGDRKTSVTGRVAVAIASWSSRAGFTQAPRRGEAFLGAACKQQRVRFSRWLKLRECSFV